MGVQGMDATYPGVERENKQYLPLEPSLQCRNVGTVQGDCSVEANSLRIV